MSDRHTSDPDPSRPAGPEVPPRAETVPPGDGDPLKRTRTGSLWVALIVFAAVLILLLIFILQNTQSVQISYVGASGQVSLAVAMLLAAAAGVLLAAIAGSLRIWQLRKRLRQTTQR